MQIYIHRDGQQYGPYPSERVPGYMASGDLLPHDLAWHEGVADWAPLNQVVAPVAPEPFKVAPAQATEHPWVPPRRDAAPAASMTEFARKAPADYAILEAYKTSPIAEPSHVSPVMRVPKSGANDLARRQRTIAARNMGIGALFLIGGSAVTYLTYEAAAFSPGGGTYFVAWGAILIGAIRFIAALIQFCQA